MRKILFVMAAITIATFTSCSSSNEPKEILPTSTDFISGELAKLIEVVDEPCQLSYAEQDGTIETQFIKLKVKLRLTKESPELKKVDARDINFTSLLSVAIISLVDINENKVQDLDIKSVDLLKLKKLLQGEKGDEETVTFESEYHNSKDAPKWYEQIAAFTPYLTGDVIVGDEAFNSMEVDDTASEGKLILKLEGQLGGSDDAVFTYDGKADEGKVTFTVNGQKNVRKLKMGSYDRTTNKLVIREYFVKGDYVGDFDGTWKDGVFQGVFTNTKGGKIDFKLMSIDDEDNSSSSLYDDSDTSPSGSEDWDALLTSYENYVDKYISYVKKAAKGDMTALAEYPSLMEKAQDFSDKLQRAQGDLSASQWARYNKITMKMMKAAQEMQQ